MGSFMNPSILTGLNPSANIGGSSSGVPGTTSAGSSAPGLGGAVNPFLPLFPNGQSMPGSMNPFASAGAGAALSSTPVATNTGGTTAQGPPAPGGTPVPGTPIPGQPNVGQSNIISQLSTGGPAGTGSGKTPAIGNNFLARGFEKAGFPKAIADMLAQFILSGSGYNSEVANALIAQMQPGIERGTESIAEQFSAEGGRFSSAAATGMGDFLSQVQLSEGQIFANLYEQSVNNYLSVLTGSKKQQTPGGGPLGAISSLLGGLGGGTGISDLASLIPSGGGAAASGVGTILDAAALGFV